MFAANCYNFSGGPAGQASKFYQIFAQHYFISLQSLLSNRPTEFSHDQPFAAIRKKRIAPKNPRKTENGFIRNNLSLCLICLVLVLLCVKFYILQEIAYQQEIDLAGRQIKSNQGDEALKKVIEGYNGDLVKMDHFYKTSPVLRIRLGAFASCKTWRHFFYVAESGKKHKKAMA